MRSTALRRYSSLRPGRKPMRRSWMRRKSPRRIAKETPAEREHKRLIHEARICAFRKYAGAGPCRGPLQAMHLGHARGMGLKHGTWEDAVLGCRSHHDQWDGRQRPSVFDALALDEREAIREDLIHLAREFVAGRQAVSR